MPWNYGLSFVLQILSISDQDDGLLVREVGSCF